MSENSPQDNYGAENITVLEGLQAVRVRPSMYIGSVSSQGLHHLVFEVIDNSIDEAMAGYCDRIDVTITQAGTVRVKDNGRGIPVGIHPTEKVSAVEVVMTKLHAGGKFDKKNYKVSGGLHGVGVSVVNALSEFLEVEVKRDHVRYRQRYERGVPVTPLTEAGRVEKTGTLVHFKPDSTIFETTEFDFEILSKRIRELAYLNKGLYLSITDDRTSQSKEFQYKGGLSEFVAHLNGLKSTIHDKPIYFEGMIGDIMVEVALQYNDTYAETILSFANNISTAEGGTHMSGFKTALTRAINQYISNGNIPKSHKKPPALDGDDVREGLAAVISVRVPEPQFEGQTKAKLGNAAIKGLVDTFLYDKLSIYLEENPNVAKKIAVKVIDAAIARKAAHDAKQAMRNKGSGSTSLSGKLADCQSKNPELCELFLVEGNSAGGSAKQGRDRKFQAILPLRGKILNVERARKDRILQNQEIRNIVTALGTGVGTSDSAGANMEKLRYHKVVIMTDADVDGSHIRTLLLTLFYRQMPELIERGHVFIAQPPLYGVKFGHKEFYLKDEASLRNFTMDRYSEDRALVGENSEEKLDGKELKVFLDALIAERDFKDRYARLGFPAKLWPLFHAAMKKNPIGLMDEAWARELAATFTANGLAVEGPVPQPLPANHEDDGTDATENRGFRITMRALHDNRKVLVLSRDFQNGELFQKYYKLKEKTSGFLKPPYTILHKERRYQLESEAELLEDMTNAGLKGFRIHRYKGLGEMNPPQLWETTMDPAKRTFMRVRVEDAMDANDIFSVLMGDEVDPRREFIQENALHVRELDI
ncbi:MAG: DNA topoisomerase (ATP-hydrolyzing) subunit B [Deltaproteobacteria bacterium]|jgi:DNA gyrase subunit B|nr:DNA topoisomerase (ATP-hydrolyzing) subunit B [Deltaproteobacteria bacterium]